MTTVFFQDRSAIKSHADFPVLIGDDNLHFERGSADVKNTDWVHILVAMPTRGT